MMLHQNLSACGGRFRFSCPPKHGAAGGEIARQRSSECSGGKGQTGVVKRSKHALVNHSKKERMCVEDLSRWKKLRARYQMSGSRLSEFGVVSRSNDLLELQCCLCPLHMQLVRGLQLFARFGGGVWLKDLHLRSLAAIYVRCGAESWSAEPYFSKILQRKAPQYQRIGQRLKRGGCFGRNFRPKEKRCAGLDSEYQKFKGAESATNCGCIEYRHRKIRHLEIFL